MNDASKIALAILVGAASVSGTLAWLGYSIREASSKPAAAVAAVAPPATAELSARAPASPLPAAAPDSPLRVTEFVERWEKGGFQKTAEDKCFGPFERAGRPLAPTLDFALEISEAGKVVKAEARSSRGDLGEIHACVATVVLSMTFPPTGAPRSGDAQASRPNAFLVAEPPSPPRR